MLLQYSQLIRLRLGDSKEKHAINNRIKYNINE